MRRKGKIGMTLATAPAPTDRRASVPGLSDIPARSWFKISDLHRAVDGEVRNDATRVDIYEEIGGWGVSAAEFVQQLRAIATPEIHLHVNSPGGSVFDGVAIFNALAQHPARVFAFVDGLAASAASFIVQAADEVVMNPGSMMMVHDAIGMTWGNAFDHTTMAGLLAQVSDSIAELYAMRAGGTAQSWRAVMEKDGGEGQWYTAEQAVEAGLADRVHGAAPDPDPATGEPDARANDTDGDMSPTNRYDSSSIAAGHRLVLAHRDEALRMAPPPSRAPRFADSERVEGVPTSHPAFDLARAVAWLEQEAAPVNPPPPAMVQPAVQYPATDPFAGSPPFRLDALIEAQWPVSASNDPFISFQ